MSSDHQANPLEKQKEKGSFNLSRWAIGHPSIARFLFGLIIVMGALGVMNMGQKEDPDFTFRVMVVQAQWPGASIEDMQNQVVNKIERKLQGIEATWADLMLEYLPHKDSDVYVVKVSDEVVEALEEHQMELQTIIGMGIQRSCRQ